MLLNRPLTSTKLNPMFPKEGTEGGGERERERAKMLDNHQTPPFVPLLATLVLVISSTVLLDPHTAVMTSVVRTLQGCLKHSIANSSIRPRRRLGKGTTLRLGKG